MRVALRLSALIWLGVSAPPAGAGDAAALTTAAAERPAMPAPDAMAIPERTAPPALIAASDAAADDDAAGRDFELAAKIGSRRAYLAFLDTHPSGRYAEQARDALRALGPPPPDQRPPHSAPNWGDGIFIERLIRKSR